MNSDFFKNINFILSEPVKPTIDFDIFKNNIGLLQIEKQNELINFLKEQEIKNEKNSKKNNVYTFINIILGLINIGILITQFVLS